MPTTFDGIAWRRLERRELVAQSGEFTVGAFQCSLQFNGFAPCPSQRSMALGQFNLGCRTSAEITSALTPISCTAPVDARADQKGQEPRFAITPA
jgi:hypothetical protein